MRQPALLAREKLEQNPNASAQPSKGARLIDITPQKHHSRKMQDVVKKAFAEAVQSAAEISLEVKKAFFIIDAAKKLSKENKEKVFATIYKNLNRKDLATLLEIDAKQQDLLRRARRVSTDDVISEYKRKPDHEQSISLVAELKKCSAVGMAAADVQRYIDQHFRAIFSLTGHPTNPTTLDYTRLGYQFDVIIDPTSQQKQGALRECLREILTTPMSGDKKKPMEEADEIQLGLEQIREVAPILREKLQAAIDASPYRGEIHLPKKLIEASVWTHGGDADGNDNMTAAVLADGYKKLRDNAFADVTIDIRHDAGDLMKAISEILKADGIADFDALSDAQKTERLAELLESEETVARLAAIDPARIADKKSAEILQRLKVCAANSGKTEKLIIANTTGAHNALTALLLLKIAGNKVAQPGAAIDIVTLSESVEDLKEIHEVQKSLLANVIYRRHLEARGRIVQMIAKSDTTRVGGPGAEFYQDQAAGYAFLLSNIAAEKFGLDLETRVFNGGGAALPRGGGKPDEAPNRQARAGLMAAAEVEEKTGTKYVVKKGPTLSTIQGHQVQMVFGSPQGAQNSLETMMTQNLHSALLIEHQLKHEKHSDLRIERLKQRFDDRAIASYQGKYFNDSYITELHANSNRAGVASGNLSSRPAKRPKGAAAAEAEVVVEGSYDALFGDKKSFDLFNTRAITLDRTLAHLGTFALMFLGLNESFAEMKAENASLSEVYKKSKPFRDSIRNKVTGLYMVDLDGAWDKAVGAGSRPEAEEIAARAAFMEPYFSRAQKIKELESDAVSNVAELQNLKLQQQQFNQQMQALGEVERCKYTLSFIDNYIVEAAKNIYSVVSGGKEAPQNLQPQDILKKYNPKLCDEMEYAKTDAGLCRYVESAEVRRFNQNGKQKLTEDDLNILRYSYNGNDIATNAPVGMSSSLTAMKNGDGYRVGDLADEIDEAKLPLPLALQNYAEVGIAASHSRL
jgi:phosphoenolpyruvate carboxylase